MKEYFPFCRLKTYAALQHRFDEQQKQLDGLNALVQRKRDNYLNLMLNVLCGMIYKDHGIMSGSSTAFSEENRQYGMDWPAHAHTMVGLKRLENIRVLTESVLGNNIPGDLIETGVWRGGASIMMRAVLHTYDITDRKVYVADSFEGLPPPDTVKYPDDTGSTFHEYAELAIPLEQVQDNFKIYGLLDEQVAFVKGWFKDTLPSLRGNTFALIRLDGDMYESTMDALTNLYDNLSLGGYLIVDDYHVVPACKQAVHDFCDSRKIVPILEEIDGVGVFWKKS